MKHCSVNRCFSLSREGLGMSIKKVVVSSNATTFATHPKVIQPVKCLQVSEQLADEMAEFYSKI